MKSSEKSAGETLFQLPFNGLGISLEACAEEAGKMKPEYGEVFTSCPPVMETSVEHTFVSVSGYDLLLTLGREIRGR
ncbi:hypothetical protein [Maridesulfovibrio sp. FT414]|uniref:hypothetical protein n=1 Tax=Maridesulfovibrio sp. FT414 TaxID=2979469 RepID=UPI003D805BBF